MVLIGMDSLTSLEDLKNNKNYKLPIYFTSCELLFTSYDLRVENKNYELQVMVLFHLKKKFTKHSDNRKSLLPVEIAKALSIFNNFNSKRSFLRKLTYIHHSYEYTTVKK